MAGLSEETAVALVHQIGELTGSVKAHIETQKIINNTVASRLETQDDKIDAVASEVNGYKKLVRGVVLGAGLGGTSLGAALMKIAGVAATLPTGGHP